MKTNCLIQLLLILFIATTLSCGDEACESVTCENGGECSKGNCYCPMGYTGDRCQYQTCDLITCPVNATCLPLGEWGAAVCRCNLGFEGHNCNTQSITKFLGEYTGVQECEFLGTSDPVDWSIVNDWFGFSDPFNIQLVQTNLPFSQQPISAILVDSLQFSVFHQYSFYHNDVIMPIGNAIRADDGTITLHFIVNFISDTCKLTFTPK